MDYEDSPQSKLIDKGVNKKTDILPNESRTPKRQNDDGQPGQQDGGFVDSQGGAEGPSKDGNSDVETMGRGGQEENRESLTPAPLTGLQSLSHMAGQTRMGLPTGLLPDWPATTSLRHDRG